MGSANRKFVKRTVQTAAEDGYVSSGYRAADSSRGSISSCLKVWNNDMTKVGKEFLNYLNN